MPAVFKAGRKRDDGTRGDVGIALLHQGCKRAAQLAHGLQGWQITRVIAFIKNADHLGPPLVHARLEGVQRRRGGSGDLQRCRKRLFGLVKTAAPGIGNAQVVVRQHTVIAARQQFAQAHAEQGGLYGLLIAPQVDGDNGVRGQGHDLTRGMLQLLEDLGRTLAGPVGPPVA